MYFRRSRLFLVSLLASLAVAVVASDFASVSSGSNTAAYIDEKFVDPISIVYPPGSNLHFRSDLGFLVFDPATFDATNLLAAPTAFGAATVFPVSVSETNGTTGRERQWFAGSGVVWSTAPPATYSPTSTVTSIFGACPEWEPLESYVAERDPWRQTVTLTLVGTDNVDAVEAVLSNALAAVQGGGSTNFPWTTNDLAFISLTAAEDGTSGYAFVPTSVPLFDLFGTTNLIAEPLGGWYLRGQQTRSGNPTAFTMSGVDLAFLALGSMVDTDQDGLPDARERLLTGTSTTNADTDADGLADGEEFLQYRTDPTRFSSMTNGLSDGWLVANGMNPSVWVNPNTTAPNGLTYAQLSAMGLPLGATVIDVGVNTATTSYRSVSVHAWKVGWLQWDYETAQPAKPKYFKHYEGSYNTSLDWSGPPFSNWWYSGTDSKDAHPENRWPVWKIQRTYDCSAAYTMEGGWTNDWSGGDGYTTVDNDVQHWFDDSVGTWGGPSPENTNATRTETRNLVDYYLYGSSEGVDYEQHIFSQVDLSSEYTSLEMETEATSELNMSPNLPDCEWNSGFSRTNMAFFTTNAASSWAERHLSADETDLVLTRMQYRVHLPTSSNGVAYRATVAHVFIADADGTTSIVSAVTYVTNGTGGAITLTSEAGVTVDPPTNNGTVSVRLLSVDLDVDTDRDGDIDSGDDYQEDQPSLTRGALIPGRTLASFSTFVVTNLAELIIRAPSGPQITGVQYRVTRPAEAPQNITLSLFMPDGTKVANDTNNPSRFDLPEWPTNDLHLFAVVSEARKGGLSGSPPVELRVELVVDGVVRASDTVAFTVAPFILPSECNPLTAVYATKQIAGITNLIVPAGCSTAAYPWAHDMVKFGRDQCVSNRPIEVLLELGHPFTENFTDLLVESGCAEKGEWDNSTYGAGDGGNMMATPPMGSNAPFGMVMVGDAHPDQAGFWTNQGVQSVISISTAWLLVGHVDEIFMWMASNKVLYASPWLAADLLHGEIAAGRETNGIWFGFTEAGTNATICDAVIAPRPGGYKLTTLPAPGLDDTTNAASIAFTNAIFAVGDVLRVDNEILTVTATNGTAVTVARAQAFRPPSVHTTGSVIYAYSGAVLSNLPIGAAPEDSVVGRIAVSSNELRTAAGLYDVEFLPIPVLFGLKTNLVNSGQTTEIGYMAKTANMVNCLVDGNGTIYYCNSGCYAFENYMATNLPGAVAVGAWTLNIQEGAVHCATAARRTLDLSPPWWQQVRIGEP